VVVLYGLEAHRPQRLRESSSKQGEQISIVLALLLAGVESHREEAFTFSKIKALVRKDGARLREALGLKP
jgi:hypothetical protein